MAGKQGLKSVLTMGFLGLSIMVTVEGCGSSTEVASSWTNTQVAIDDSVQRWAGVLKEIKDTHVSVGVLNDTSYMYLCLVAPQDQFRRQMMGPGLTMWFESDDGKKVGIHYPMGFSSQSRLENPEGDGEQQQPQVQRGQALLGQIEIIGPGKYDRNVLSPLELRDMKVKIGDVGSQTVYQLKLPLHESADHPYAAGVSPGSTLKIEIESGTGGARNRGEGNSEGGGMRGGGGRRGGRGGGGGYPGGGMGGGGRRSGGGSSGANRPEPIDETVKVQLANTSGGAHQ